MQTASLVREFAVDPYALFVIALPETETARTVGGLKPQTTPVPRSTSEGLVLVSHSCPQALLCL